MCTKSVIFPEGQSEIKYEGESNAPSVLIQKSEKRKANKEPGLRHEEKSKTP